MLRVLILLSLGLMCAANVNPPQVNVYTYKPIKEGEKNVLLCHAKNFSPPGITLQLLQGNSEIPNTNQSDLSFGTDWRFKMTSFVEIYPKNGVEFSCRVLHNGISKTVKLES